VTIARKKRSFFGLYTDSTVSGSLAKSHRNQKTFQQKKGEESRFFQGKRGRGILNFWFEAYEARYELQIWRTFVLAGEREKKEGATKRGGNQAGEGRNDRVGTVGGEIQKARRTYTNASIQIKTSCNSPQAKRDHIPLGLQNEEKKEGSRSDHPTSVE